MAGNGFDTKFMDNLLPFYKKMFVINQFSKDLSPEEGWQFILRQHGTQPNLVYLKWILLI